MYYTLHEWEVLEISVIKDSEDAYFAGLMIDEPMIQPGRIILTNIINGNVWLLLCHNY